MSTTSKPLVKVHLVEQEGRNIVVCPDDHDRFVVQVRHAVEVLKVDQGLQSQLNLLLRKLAVSVDGRHASHGDVAAVILTLADRGFLAVVIRRDKGYSSGFEDALTQLDIDIANSPDLRELRVEVVGVPKARREAIQSLIQLEYSPSNPTPRAGKKKSASPRQDAPRRRGTS